MNVDLETIIAEEGDALDFVDESTGYRCAMRRNQMKAWCGYVQVPPSHPWHGKSYNDQVPVPAEVLERPVSMDELGVMNVFCASVISTPEEGLYAPALLVRCHGGLTYSGHPWWDKADQTSWWFGFDCNHAGDITPAYPQTWGEDDVYRDVAYVKSALAKACADLSLFDRVDAPVTGEAA
ncbi:hypothetical protein JL101_035725 (plasmid) [Skermanella rosea]|uniref:hypothetical protein n=1 Tax=Skermanella rosea TaxID=1817965 RepID=UPI0019343BB0|nr:hypothetical protein [Skermanella rosea]UEM08002.1 hypothetical protein JL101_035725 [Skermanella rosea]